MSAATEGLTRTSPLTAAPRISAIRRARQPPMDRPITNISLALAAQFREGAVRLRVPVLPPGPGHLLPGGAVAGQPGQRHGQPARPGTRPTAAASQGRR